MKRLYIITGAAGHLGYTIIRMLKQQGEKIRGLILPNQVEKEDIEYVKGDLTQKESLIPLFKDTEGYETIVIHTAGIISISDQVSDKVYQVNVGGTKNLIHLCLKFHVSKFVYVSSVHAIPEKKKEEIIKEVDHFSAGEVHGEYAKTKAMATQIVLDEVKNGLPAVVVHPSGIIGPYGGEENHLIQLIIDYANKKLPACVKGGYDFVDVRDVAQACIQATKTGKIGECYILSNKHYEIKDILKIIRKIKHCRKVPTLPVWMAKMFLPGIRIYSRIKKQRPLYTKYSLYTLKSNDRFSHEKASKTLNYHPRDIYETIKDTLIWLRKKKICIN